MHLITRPILEALKFTHSFGLEQWCINPLLEIKLNSSPFIELSKTGTIEDYIFIATSANAIRIFEGLSISFNVAKIRLITNSNLAYQSAKLLGIDASFLSCENLQIFTKLLISQLEETANIIYLSGNYTTMPIATELQKHNFKAQAIIIYESIARSLIPPVIQNILAGKITSLSLFSARTARIMLNEIKKHQLEKSLVNIEIWAISEKVAKIIAEIAVKKIYIMSNFINERANINLTEVYYD